jgi:hypothetical protein
MAVELSLSGSNNPIHKARYQITKNVFVHCYLQVLNANNQEVRLLLGVKHRSDTQVPIGTRVFINPTGIHQEDSQFSAFSVAVLSVEERKGQFIHICTPISRELSDNRRAQPRLSVDFPVLLVDSQTIFWATDGSPQGLGLTYSAQRAILKLTLNGSYDFKLNCKGEDFTLSGVIKHIQYDWRTFQHRVGIHFPELTKDKLMFLSIMVDPDYIVPISNTQTVDSGVGKISHND